MPRPPRLQYAGAFYHVFSRGNWKERIFWDDLDYATFEKFLIEAMEWSGVRLYNWSLMPNHFHFLLQTPDGNLAEFMQRLLTRYAKYFNWRHQKVGHLFQSRYGARVCDKEEYFLALVRYVELNPYRLKKGMLAKLGEWKWSSLRYYLGKAEAPEGLRHAMDEVFGRFGKTLAEARRGMANFLADGLRIGDWEDFYKPRGNRYLGDDQFIERAKAASGERVRIRQRALRRFDSIEHLAQWMKECGAVDLEAVCSATQKRAISRWRQALVIVGRTHYRFPVHAMARYLNRDGTAISQILRRLAGKYEDIDEVRKLIGWVGE